MKDKYLLLAFSCFILSFTPVFGDGPVPDYDLIAAQVFWDKLYPFGGWTLYCGYRFEHDRKIKATEPVSIEHIYPTSEIIKQLHCGNRMRCRDSGNKKFARMEADMHNMYPVWSALVTFRNGSRFGHIDGEHWRFEDCDIEWQGGILEPRPLARGNVARAMLYMQEHYGLTLEPETVKTMVQWNKEDPTSNQEIERNDQIEAIQGNRNPFIDDPARAEKLLRSTDR